MIGPTLLLSGLQNRHPASRSGGLDGAHTTDLRHPLYIDEVSAFSPANSRVPILFFWEMGQYAHPYTMGPAQGDTGLGILRSFLRSFLTTSCIAVLDRIHPERVKT